MVINGKIAFAWSSPDLPRLFLKEDDRMELICGIDEAGRGPLAGPVTAAAVILPDDFPIGMLADSKRLSERRRILAADAIKERAVCWGIGWVSPRDIDRINILQASLLAMKRAYEQMILHSCPDAVIPHKMISVYIDGLYVPQIEAKERSAVVRGDSTIPAIMAASILAKTARDNWMVSIAKKYPSWDFDRHKGYPTAHHKALCREFGISPIHRKSFRISS